MPEESKVILEKNITGKTDLKIEERRHGLLYLPDPDVVIQEPENYERIFPAEDLESQEPPGEQNALLAGAVQDHLPVVKEPGKHKNNLPTAAVDPGVREAGGKSLRSKEKLKQPS